MFNGFELFWLTELMKWKWTLLCLGWDDYNNVSYNEEGNRRGSQTFLLKCHLKKKKKPLIIQFLIQHEANGANSFSAGRKGETLYNAQSHSIQNIFVIQNYIKHRNSYIPLNPMTVMYIMRITLKKEQNRW